MSTSAKLVALVVVLLVNVATSSHAQPSEKNVLSEPNVRHSVSIQGGYSLTTGDWMKSRPAPDVSFFKGHLLFGAEVAFRLSDVFVLAVNGGYTNLNQSDWEDYARSRGDNIMASASASFISLLLRPYLKSTPPDQVMIDCGALVLFANGSEKIGGRSFEYDFLAPWRIGGQGAIEYDRMLGANSALTVRLAALIVPSAVRYADGESFTLVAFPLTIGFKCFL